MAVVSQRGDGQPWLGLRILLVAAVLLIATKVDDVEHTFARAVIVGLWVLTAFAAMLKESLTYGLGDRVTLFGALLILAVSVAATMIDNHPYSFVSLGSIGFALIMLRQVFKNVMARQRAAAPYDGPG
jgi:uncharacterized membrane protein YoaK (UPF0700 family)